MTPDAKKLTLAERIGGVLLGAIALLVILLLALPFLLGGQAGVYVHLILTLIFGWIEFYSRTLPAIRWNLPMIALSGFCLAGIGFGLNRILKWFSGFVAEKLGKSFIWPTRWTWGTLLAVGLFFAVGMSVGGVLHQVGWMAGSEEPMVVSKRSRFSEAMADMKMLAAAYDQYLLDSESDIDLAAQKTWANKDDYIRNPGELRSKYQIYVLLDENGKYLKHIIKPRDSKSFLQYGGWGPSSGHMSVEEAQKLLSSFNSRLRAF